MSRFNALTFAGLLALPFMATAAHAQDGEKGIYAVARAGMAVNPDQKLKLDSAPVTTFDDKTKYKSGFTGEIGGGYNFGMFRIEQTAGYMSLKAKDLAGNGFAGDGRNKAFYVSINGFVDIPVSKVIVPFVGAGAGIARVDATLTRNDNLSGISSSYSGKDWGMLWHGDAGVGVHVAPKVTLEIAGRYTQVGSLKYKGFSSGQDAVYKPTMRTISGTVGVRYQF